MFSFWRSLSVFNRQKPNKGRNTYTNNFVGTIKGDRLLDIGTGPICYAVYPPSKWFKEIVLSDLSAYNLAALNQWKNGKIQYGEAIFNYMMELDGNK